MRPWLACLASAASIACAQPLDEGAALAASGAVIGSTPGNYAFTDSSGRRVALADFRGKPLVVSFVYTGCTQVCPTTTRFLDRAVREARGVVGQDAFRVASIGFDVPSDNPVSMRVFARAQGIDGDARWALLVPDAATVAQLGRDFGFSWRDRSGAIEHIAQATILDAQGRIHAQVQGETFNLAMLVQPLRELALGEPPAQTGIAAAIQRVRLLCTVYDPATGAYRLDYRLFIELAVGFLVLGATGAFLVRERRKTRRG